MKKNTFVKALSAGVCVAMGLAFASCDKAESTTEQQETKETTSETTALSSEETDITSDETAAATEEITGNPYESFIEGYRDAIINQTSVWYYGPDREVDELDPDIGPGLIVAEMSDYLYYTLYDLDNDGVPELLIGLDVTGDHMASRTTLTGIVTLDGSNYKIVAAGWSRSSLEYVGEGYFVNSGSGGAFLHYDAVYSYDGAAKELATVGILVTEYSETDDTDIHYSYFADEKDAYAAFPAYGNEKAVCFDEDAQQMYDADYDLAMSKTNELLGTSWEIVDLHDL